MRGCFFRGRGRRGYAAENTERIGIWDEKKENGPERDGGKKLTSGPRHRRAVDRVLGKKNGQKWGHSLTLGVVRASVF